MLNEDGSILAVDNPACAVSEEKSLGYYLCGRYPNANALLERAEEWKMTDIEFEIAKTRRGENKMKLEEFVKNLKPGELVKLESADENCRVVEIWLNDKGEYNFALEFLECDNFKTPEDLLKFIAENYGVKYVETEFEIYKTRAELKSENAKLKKALEIACEMIDKTFGGHWKHCWEICPCAGKDCTKNYSRPCKNYIYDKLTG